MNIKKMIPFLEEEEIAEVARRVLDGDEGYQDINLHSLLPFMDEDDIDEMAAEIFDREGKANALLPFMSEEGVAKLARHVLEKEDGQEANLHAFLPYMDEEDIDEMAVEIYEKEGKASDLLPFMSEEGIAELAAAMVDNNDTGDLFDVFPYLDDDDADKLFLALAYKGMCSPNMYPFVSEDGWHEVLEGYIAGEFDFSFDEAYPFMDEDDIRDLFRFEMEKKKHR